MTIPLPGRASSPHCASPEGDRSAVGGHALLNYRSYRRNAGTGSETWNVDVPFDCVYLVYWNDTTSGYRLTKAAVAPSASLEDRYSPVDALGAAVPFTAVTFNNNGRFAAPSATAAGSVTTFDVPAAPAADIHNPIYAYSDPIPVTALPRVDGGKGHLLMARTYVASGSLVGQSWGHSTATTAAATAAGGSGFQDGPVVLSATVTAGDPTTLLIGAAAQNGTIVSADRIYNPVRVGSAPSNPVAMTDVAGNGNGCTLNLTWASVTPGIYLGRDFYACDGPGDGIAVPSSFSPRWYFRPATVGIIAVSRSCCANVAVFGSSWSQGKTTPFNMTSYAQLAVNAVSSPVLPINCWNAAKDGETSANCLNNAIALVPILKPHVTFIEAWNGNDGITAAGVQGGWDNAMAIAELVRSHGGVPVMVGVIPSGAANNRRKEELRQQVNTWLDNYVMQGGVGLFPDRTWGAGTNPNTYKPGYSGDGTHPTRYAHILLATGPTIGGPCAARTLQQILRLPVTF